MKIEIPDELFEEFLNFLDISQASFTEQEINTFSEDEKKVIKLVEDILENYKQSPSQRYNTKPEMERARYNLIKFWNILYANKF